MNFQKLKTMIFASNHTPPRPAGTPPLVMGGECLADTRLWYEQRTVTIAEEPEIICEGKIIDFSPITMEECAH